MTKIKCAILGSGNIGTDLMFKVLRNAKHLEITAVAGIDPNSDGLGLARRMGIAVTSDGIRGLRELKDYQTIDLVFDATSAKAHVQNNEFLMADRKKVIDLTPAAVGPFTIPTVNLAENMNEPNVNMVTCGGQATIPIVYAIKRAVGRLVYAEIVASIASKSAGPGTRANIDEFTETTARAIETVGGAEKGKAIIILNPAEPPVLMRDTIFALSQGGSPVEIEASVCSMVEAVQAYVPGFRLKQKIQFEFLGDNEITLIPGIGASDGLKTTVFVEVEGAAHYLPAYAGNLDIMTSAALATADLWAGRSL
jgi:acetaldehyde dehydrogenase